MKSVSTRTVAVLVALATTLIAVASASAGSGGISSDGGSAEDKKVTLTHAPARQASCSGKRFGKRTLRYGDCGRDVKTLNWILRAEAAKKVRTKKRFIGKTHEAVRKFQRNSSLRRTGIVNKKTRKALVKRMDKSIATWYGPGFWGNRTACGQKLTKKTIGVAHKQLPCGTKVTIKRGSKFVRARVIDRGPYAHGATWDLTQATAKRVGMTQTSTVRAAVVR